MTLQAKAREIDSSYGLLVVAATQVRVARGRARGCGQTYGAVLARGLIVHALAPDWWTKLPTPGNRRFEQAAHRSLRDHVVVRLRV